MYLLKDKLSLYVLSWNGGHAVFCVKKLTGHGVTGL
jgi:hypothetical protein